MSPIRSEFRMVVSGGAVSPENRSNEAVTFSADELDDAIDYGDESYFWPGVDFGERGNIADVLRDLRATRARLAAIEREQDSLREDVKIRDAEITRQHGIILALDNDADHALTDRDEAIEAESQAGDRIAAERDAALARIAAVEAPQNVERLCEVMHDAYERAAVGAGWETQQASRKPWADVPEANKATMRAAVSALLAALAASPTPTTEEQS